MEQLARTESTRPRREAEEPLVPPLPSPWIASPARAACRIWFKRWFELDLVGQRHIPARGPAIIIPNHPTYVDPWLVGLGTRRWITWMAWEDAFRWPVFGAVIRSMGAFPVNLDRPRPSTIKAAVRVLGQGRLLGLFFEGGRTAGADPLDPPRRGGARLALMAGVPVIPVSISGARRLWPRDRLVPGQGKVVIRYHPPIDPSAVLPGEPGRAREERLTELVCAAIRSALPADGRPRRRRGRELGPGDALHAL